MKIFTYIFNGISDFRVRSINGLSFGIFGLRVMTTFNGTYFFVLRDGDRVTDFVMLFRADLFLFGVSQTPSNCGILKLFL